MPLLIDEALGTSDDERAAAIMQTLLKVVEEGRQVFYFTAQSDEVGKWLQVLEANPTVSFKRIDLQALRTGNPPQPLMISESSTEAKPDPAQQPDETKQQWAARLGVPEWTPQQPPESIPLFLLLADKPHILTACTRIGVSTWGPLRNLLQAKAARGAVPPEEENSLQARGLALKALCEAWRIGRPPPVDPDLVMNSGCVSDAFSEEMLHLMETVEYDGKRIIDQLRNKAVSGWRQANTDHLENLFYEHGLLTDDVILSEEELHATAWKLLEDKDKVPLEEWQFASGLIPA